jgi:dienelactone hydrolase
MNQRRKNRGSRRFRALTLAAPVMMLLGACSDDSPDPIGPEVDGEPYLEEIYEFEVENEIQYGAAIDENGVEQALHLDLYRPTNDDGTLRPAIVWLHGGSYVEGHRGEMTEIARRFALRGFVSVSADYRLREGAVVDYTDPDDPLAEPVKLDAQHDAQAAVRWLRANADQYGIDSDQIYVGGYSAGGTAALRVTANSDDPGASGNPDQASDVAGTVAIAASLEPNILEEGGPTLLIHGGADTKVPFAAIEEACAPVADCELVGIAEGVHSLMTPYREEIIAAAATFLHAQVTGS